MSYGNNVTHLPNTLQKIYSDRLLFVWFLREIEPKNTQFLIKYVSIVISSLFFTESEYYIYIVSMVSNTHQQHTLKLAT